MNNYMVCNSAPMQMKHLNESANSEKYVLEGVFATLDGTANRNGRIYTTDEYLKHLQYLRHDIESGDALLGELDHPDDRFETKIKEASHRVTNIWYDEKNNTIMGRIELLDTPNGKIAKSLVDQGIPLHISSRAAGTVNSDNTVNIQQIYTYDLVAKPGFAAAVLHRVNESVDSVQYDQDTNNFLRTNEIMEARNLASQFMLNENEVTILPMSVAPKLRKEVIKESENEKINNTEINNTTMVENKIFDSIQNNSVNKSNILIESDENAEETQVSTEKKSDDEKSDDEKSDVTIISVRAVDADGETIKVESDETDKKSDENTDSDDKDEKSEENQEPEKTDECGDATVKCNKSTADDKQERKVTDANKLNDAAKSDLSKKKSDFLKTIKELTSAIEKKNECKECSNNESATMAQYPVSMMMNESNFAKFSALSESQKNKVTTYLKNNQITNKKDINEQWSNGLNVEEEPVWLKFAPANYKSMYESAPDNVKKSLNNTAKYLIFESQRDINVFWENSGLEYAESRRLLNESFVANMPKIVAKPVETELPYGSNLIQQIADMASEYNM